MRECGVTLKDSEYLPPPEHSWTAITWDGGNTAVVGQGVDKVDVPVSKPVEAEYDEVIASSTDGLPFRKSLWGGEKREELLLHQNGLNKVVYFMTWTGLSGVS